MNAYDIGDLVRVSSTFKNSEDVIADPTTTTFKLKAATDNIIQYIYGEDDIVVKDSTGIYHVDLLIDRAGQWTYRWEGTGLVTAAGETSFAVNRSAFYP